ncbi:hypothetical protein [Sphingorhabdus lutea]|nr:hypothetical protein [Sphingorhabdus lutea]
MLRHIFIILFLVFLALPAAAMPNMGHEINDVMEIYGASSMAENCHEMAAKPDQHPMNDKNGDEFHIMHQCIGCIGGQYIFAASIINNSAQSTPYTYGVKILYGSHPMPDTPPPKS